MRQKPTVCLIDEDENVKIGWTKTLSPDANLVHFQDHLELFNHAARNEDLVNSFSCIIVGRYFKHLNLDVVSSSITDTLKAAGAGPIFLNWQGYITKEEVNAHFDGKLFHRYGVKWQTLRLRIQKYEKSQKTVKKPFHPNTLTTEKTRKQPVSKPERCSELLKTMANKARGPHKDKIEHYAYQDTKTGIQHGKTNAIKKAIVQLAEGETIDLYSNM